MYPLRATFRKNALSKSPANSPFDEQAHMKLLRGALTAKGIMPVAKPAIDPNALNFGFAGDRSILSRFQILL